MNKLIRPYKNLVDSNKIAFLAAVDVSYLAEEEQEILYSLTTDRKLRVTPKMAEQLRKASGCLTEEKILEIVDCLHVKKGINGVNIKLPQAICSKYFEGLNADQMANIVEQALASWFEGARA